MEPKYWRFFYWFVKDLIQVFPFSKEPFQVPLRSFQGSGCHDLSLEIHFKRHPILMSMLNLLRNLTVFAPPFQWGC